MRHRLYGGVRGRCRNAPLYSINRRQSYMAAELVQYTKKYGLSLADRACIALALNTGYPILTADKTCKKLEIENVTINLIR